MESNLIGEVIDNKYRIDAPLGEGGMGIVYKAWDRKLERPVALKVMRPDLIKDESVLKRFLIEAKALAKLEHPNIVTVYELGELQGSFFIVMQFVDGITLAQKLADSGALPYREALPIFKQILAAIGYAHQNEIIHRDIKPSNVMLTPQSVVKVMDFGVAKIQQSADPTLANMVVGTLRYMPPEQITGGAKIDRRSDIYSLGMTLYEMLAGRLPFEMPEENLYALAKIIVEQELFPPGQFNPAVPTTLAGIVMKAIAKEPDRRFQNTEEMLTAIETFEMDPVAAPPARSKITEETVLLGEIKEGDFAPLNVSSFPRRRHEEKQRRWLVISVTLLALIAVALGIYKFPHLLAPAETKRATAPPASSDSTAWSAGKTATPNLTTSALMKELAKITAAGILNSKLLEYQQTMLLAMGQKEDFEPVEGCYVFVLDNEAVLGVFQFKNNLYTAVNSNEQYAALPEQFSGKRAIWVKDYSVK